MNEASSSHLLDTVTAVMGLQNDAQLSRALGVAAPVISKLRHKRLPLGSVMILKIHEASMMPIAEIKHLAGLPAYVRTDAEKHRRDIKTLTNYALDKSLMVEI